jgi:hypothetical protein
MKRDRFWIFHPSWIKMDDALIQKRRDDYGDLIRMSYSENLSRRQRHIPVYQGNMKFQSTINHAH